MISAFILMGCGQGLGKRTYREIPKSAYPAANEESSSEGTAHVVLNHGALDHDASGEEKGEAAEAGGLESGEAEAGADGSQEDQTVSVVFAGDILFDESYAIMASMKQRGGRIEDGISEGLLKRLRAADIFMVNNEFPYTDRGTPTAGKTFTFRARPEYASYLLDMGADLVSLANNHAYDYGEISLLDSLDTLEGIGIPYVGAGRNFEEASEPVYMEANGLTIAFVAATQIERMASPDTKGATETSPGVFRCRKSGRFWRRFGKRRKRVILPLSLFTGEQRGPTPWIIGRWNRRPRSPKPERI